jgi:hypothetical protein
MTIANSSPPIRKALSERRERHRVARGHRPLSLDLLLEPAVVAEARQGVTERLRSGTVVGILEDAPCLLQPNGGLQHAPCQPQRDRAERPGEGQQDDGRDDE